MTLKKKTLSTCSVARLLATAVMTPLILFSTPSVASEEITYSVKPFTHMAEAAMNLNDHEAGLYEIHMSRVSEFLPERIGIKRDSIKRIDRHLLPGKTLIKMGRGFVYHPRGQDKKASAKSIFAGIAPELVHTYVLLKDKLIFTQSTNNPDLEKNIDKFTKHYFISGLRKHVHYSGEFIVYENQQNGEIFVVFDNASGTYRPPSDYLPNLEQVLKENFKTHGYANNKPSRHKHRRVFFVTKSFEDKIDLEKLFAHEKDPFVKA